MSENVFPPLYVGFNYLRVYNYTHVSIYLHFWTAISYNIVELGRFLSFIFSLKLFVLASMRLPSITALCRCQINPLKEIMWLINIENDFYEQKKIFKILKIVVLNISAPSGLRRTFWTVLCVFTRQLQTLMWNPKWKRHFKTYMELWSNISAVHVLR